MKRFLVEPEHNSMLVGAYLVEIHNYSRRGLRNAEVYLNGKKARLDKKMKNLKNQNKILVVEKKKETGIKPIEMDLKIAYEDKNLLIIDKPPYIIVHPTQKKVDQTLANGVVDYFQRTLGEILIPRFYNRLDMNTSGLIVVAKNAYTQSFLQDTGEVKKYYKALVKGIMPRDEYLIERPIGKVGDDLRRKELSPEEGGQSAKTMIRVLERDEKNNLTLIEAELFTGRTHQIRAHLSLEGFPILGDELYGGEDSRAGRQMLHSYKLMITNPDTGELMEIKAGIPDDMLKILSIKD
ncbi:MAG: RluA family pseudouridine synthase [Fusobacteriaceae bacterium]